jgi:hypothetical protein
MMPHHSYDPLALVGLLWLCVMLHSVWPSRGAVSPPPPEPPVPPLVKRQRSHAPPPFVGLPQRPHGALCEHEATHPEPQPPRRPAPMAPPTQRRGPSTPRCPFAPMPAGTLAAGSGLATSARMAIPAAVRGAHGRVVLCRKAPSRYPPARGGGRASGEPALPERRRQAALADGVPRLRPRRAGAGQRAPPVAGSPRDQRQWRGAGVAAMDAGDGGGMDRSRVDVAREAAVSGAPVAATSGRVKSWWVRRA